MAHEDGNSTRAVHAARSADPATRAIAPPIVQSSAFAFPDLETWAAAAESSGSADSYSRNTNPTVRSLEARIAALEGAEGAVAFPTGMAAIATTLLTLLRPGQRAVAVRDAYGATFLLFKELLPSFGIECAVVDTDDRSIAEAVAGGCALLYVETPTNPTLKTLDLGAAAHAARAAGGLLVVDNTFATPINQNPLALGADLVVHSATKYLCGHGDALGGLVCGDTAIADRIFRMREITGPALDAHSAFLLLRSLLTLGLRVERHNDNGQRLSEFLATHPAVEQVFYPGLSSHPGHAIARRQMRGFGGVLGFTLRGGADAVRRLLPRLRLARLAPNLGQVETTVGPAFLTSHVELDEAARRDSGVPDHLVRYAAGIEDADDLITDLDQALADS